jgi:hypothetical protein
MLQITNMVTMWNVEVISDKCNEEKLGTEEYH